VSAADALKAARAAGVDLRLDGDDLVLEASAPPPLATLDLVSRHKPGIVALLRPGGDGWSPEDWQVFFDEPAGIAEFDGGLPRPEAEARAFECCIVEWLNRNFVRSPPACCLACGGGDHPHDALLPHGFEPTGHVWLHSGCWPACRAARRAGGPGGDGDHKTFWVQTISIKRRRMTGGCGSGRPSGGGRAKVEACRSIDVNRLHREGCLRGGWMGGWQWSRDGEQVASINLRSDHDRLHLTYRARIGSGEWEHVSRASASSACPVGSAARGPFSSVPAW
jgi:hypothetical protein